MGKARRISALEVMRQNCKAFPSSLELPVAAQADDGSLPQAMSELQTMQDENHMSKQTTTNRANHIYFESDAIG